MALRVANNYYILIIHNYYVHSPNVPGLYNLKLCMVHGKVYGWRTCCCFTRVKNTGELDALQIAIKSTTLVRSYASSVWEHAVVSAGMFIKRHIFELINSYLLLVSTKKTPQAKC